MLANDIIMPIYSPFGSPVVLYRKKNGNDSDDPETWRFPTDYRKLDTITHYLQFPILVIDEILVNITSTNFVYFGFDLRLFSNCNEAGEYCENCFYN